MAVKSSATSDNWKKWNPLFSRESTSFAVRVQEQLDRILAHPLFARSKRSSCLLKHIVTLTLSGEQEELKERKIAQQIFGRDASFDLNDDAIVRVAAGEVRRRLQLYYTEPEHIHEPRIHLPVGVYAAEFEFEEKCSGKMLVSGALSTLRMPKWIYFSVGLVSLFVALCLWGGYRYVSAPSAIERFWMPITHSRSPALILISSLYNPQVEGNDVPVPVDILQSHAKSSDLSPQRLVLAPKRDISSAIAIITFLERYHKAPIFQISQNTSLEDITQSPLILIGGLGNEWGARLIEPLRFKLNKDTKADVTWIQDETNPGSRAWFVNKADSVNKAHKDRKEYALITRALSRSTGQWWVGVSGLTGLGTLVAQQDILDPNFMAVLSRQLPRGWEKKSLQIVLEIEVINESPGTSRIVALSIL